MSASTFKRFAIPTALVVGGVTVGSFVAPIGLASADGSGSGSSGSAAADPEGTGVAPSEVDPGHPGHPGRRGPAFGPAVDVLEDLLGLTAEEIHDRLADGETLVEVAEAQGVSSEELTAALAESIGEHIDQAVADGRLDADEAEQRKADLEDRIAAMITRVPPVPPEGAGRLPGGPHPGPGGFVRGGTEVLEDVLGLTGEEIRQGLADGKTLADLAEEQGVPVDDLADALAAAATERIDQAVEDGMLDADRAAQAKANLEDMIDRAIEAEPFALGRHVGRAEGRAFARRHHGTGMPGDQGPGQDGSAPEGAATGGSSTSGTGDVVDGGF